MKYKKINLMFVYLIISLVFVIPLSMSNIYAGDPKPAPVPGKTESEIGKMCSGGGAPDAGSSIVLSAVTLCLPGVLEKIMDYQQIKCEAVVCSYESILREQDPSFCKAKEGYDVCVFVVGEMFAIPPLALLEYWRNAIADLLRDPLGIGFGIAVMFYRAELYAMCGITKGSPTCKTSNPTMVAAAVPLAVIDIQAAIETFTAMAENGFDGGDNSDDMCEEMGDIKDKLENIKDKLESRISQQSSGSGVTTDDVVNP